MKKLWIVGFLLVVLVVVASHDSAGTTSSAGLLGPAGSVGEFYRWYLDYIGDGDGMRNPLVNGAYRSSPHLSPQFVKQVDELVAGFEGGGFDPFLMAQDVPAEIHVGEATVTDHTAVVPVTSSFPGHRFTVTLEEMSPGLWQITAIMPNR